MKISSQWLDDFVKWFFNASPVWVDPRSSVDDVTSLSYNRRVHGERRRDADTRGTSQPAGRSNRS